MNFSASYISGALIHTYDGRALDLQHTSRDLCHAGVQTFMHGEKGTHLPSLLPAVCDDLLSAGVFGIVC